MSVNLLKYDRTGKILLYNIQDNVRRKVVSGEDVTLKMPPLPLKIMNFMNTLALNPWQFCVRVCQHSCRRGQARQFHDTQQLIKRPAHAREKISQIKEWILALKIVHMSKKKLNLYLNESPYGGSIYGVEEASKVFGRRKDVTLAESAYLPS